MANSYTEAQALQIVNTPAVGYLRAYGSGDTHRKTVFTNSFSFSASPELFTQAFDDTGDVYDAIASETAEMSFDTGLIFDLDYLELISGGLMSKTTTSAGATACNTQTIAAGWTNKALNVLNLVSTASGEYLTANGEPAITSVVASTVGALTANDDYTIVPDANAVSGYSIVFNEAGSTEVDPAESILITYNSPVVLATESVSMGGIKNYSPVEGYILTQNRAGKNVRIDFYKAYWNANFAPAFGSENSPEAATSSFTFSIKLDGTRTVGDQLYKVTVAT